MIPHIDFSFTNGYDWLCYNFHTGLNERTKELKSLLTGELIRPLLGNEASDSELNTEIYAVRSGSPNTVTAFALVPEEDRKNDPLDLLKPTNRLWKMAVVCAGYNDDLHGETAVIDHTPRKSAMQLTHYYKGNPDYKGWDAGVAASDGYKGRVHFQLDAPGVHGMEWPHPGDLEDDSFYFYCPEDYYETGHQLPNALAE